MTENLNISSVCTFTSKTHSMFIYFTLEQRKVGLLRRSKADLFMGQSDGDTEMANGGGSSNSDNGDAETSAS